MSGIACVSKAKTVFVSAIRLRYDIRYSTCMNKKKQNGQEMNNYPIITRIVDNRRYACVFGKGDNI